MGNEWDSYITRVQTKGNSVRDANLRREKAFINRRLPTSLSYEKVKFVSDCAEYDQNVAIIDTDNLEIKYVLSMPGEDIINGSLIYWSSTYWLVTEKDLNNKLYTRAKMEACNYLLRWIYDGKIIERWCIISDGTKYLTGETISSYNDNGMALGDTRIAMTITRDRYTVQLNRENRFLIDDYDSKSVLAYRLTKPFKLGGVYNGHGAMSFVLSEVNTEDDDNFELHIADYYKYFPRERVCDDDECVLHSVEDSGSSDSGSSLGSAIINGNQDDPDNESDINNNNQNIGKKVWF